MRKNLSAGQRRKISLRKNGRKGVQISHTNRLAIYMRDNYTCQYCASSMIKHGDKMSLDHIKPHSEGGKDHHTNLVTACQQCNRVKGTRSTRKFAVAAANYIDRDPSEVIRGIRSARRRECGESFYQRRVR